MKNKKCCTKCKFLKRIKYGNLEHPDCPTIVNCIFHNLTPYLVFKEWNSKIDYCSKYDIRSKK